LLLLFVEDPPGEAVEVVGTVDEAENSGEMNDVRPYIEGVWEGN
jgi:hypothetical protein